MEGPWVFLFLLGAFSLQNVMIQPAQGSTKSDDCGLLRKRVEDLEIEVEKLKESLQSLDLTINQKDDLVTIDEPRSIDEDIAQNTEDIFSIRVDVLQHDVLIAEGQSDINTLNVTLHYDIETLGDEIAEFNTTIDDAIAEFKTTIEDEIAEFQTTIENEIAEFKTTIDGEIEQTRPPLGSVIAWLPQFSPTKDIPEGWQRCDGSPIMTGPFTGQVTPDLNEANRYLRGGLDEISSQIQEDAVQDHTHLDEGHTHQDAGHTHTDAGHPHEFKDQAGFGTMYGKGTKTEEDHVGSLDNEASTPGLNYYKFVTRTDNGKAQIQTSNANIQNSKSGMGKVDNGRKADETRPKSMYVVYIMRIF